MHVPITPAFFRGLIAPGQILFFKNPEFPSLAHPHIFITQNGGDALLLGCGTSQQGTVERYIEKNSLSLKTAVCISPNATNGLNKHTFLNCNDMPFEFTLTELNQLYGAGQLNVLGTVSPVDMEKILMGYVESDVIDAWLQDLVRPLIDPSAFD